MDLRIADAHGLVDFIHRTVARSGKQILSSGGIAVVEIDGVLFYHSEEPVTVGGPFHSIESLVRSEGIRRYPEGPADVAPGYEVFEWAGSFFRIETVRAGPVRQYPDLEQAKRGAALERERPSELASPAPRTSRTISVLPALVAHADWGSDAKKRWMCVAKRTSADRFYVSAPEPVEEATTLLRRLSDRAGGNTVLVGFDFPIGVPAAYAEKAGIDRFPEFLAKAGRDGWSRFYDVAERADEIGVRRPFYPKRSMKKGDVAQRDLLDGLGVASMRDLLRTCDRPTDWRGAACPIFWTLGGKQVGKAALIGWREVLAPALRDPSLDVGIWPFDGDLPDLLRRNAIVVVETYPAEACTHLGLTPPGRGWSKTSQEGRRAQASKLLAWARQRCVDLEPALTASIEDGFGSAKSAEDPFDAVVGLFSMLDVSTGRRAAGAPDDGVVKNVEGWILGQDGLAGSLMP